MSDTMKAVVIKSPFKVAVEQRPIPKAGPGECVVKVNAAALCGSDMHVYRGHQPVPHYDFVMGHEFEGTVSEVGEGIKQFKVGDRIISPFTVCCGDCFYCSREETSRCVKNALFGSVALDGAQAEYVRVPLADTTLYAAPEGISPQVLILMADIFPTGYFVAQNAWKMLNEKEREDATCVVIGCGPVGLCAVTAATHFFKHVYAIDSIPERLEAARKHGAIKAIHLTDDDPIATIMTATEGRGADVVCEVVGAEPALQMAIQLARPWGVVSSCGVHTHDITFKGLDLYNKNLRFQFGRCPVRALFGPALELLKQKADLFESFVQHTVPVEEAPRYYELFNEQKVLKTVFKF